MKDLIVLIFLFTLSNFSSAQVSSIEKSGSNVYETPSTLEGSLGEINGKVSNPKNNETLIGSIVNVEGKNIGTVTDFDGNFSLKLNPGKYNLVINLIGFEKKIVQNVVVKKGMKTNLEILLMETSQNLSEVTVTASYKKSSLGSMYSIQKNNMAISDGISSDIIKKSPDNNTSDVLKRVSGTSIVDNKFVVIRGLNDRYNSTLINSSPQTSTEPDKKAFSFDIFPSNLIDNLTVTKTASPDLPGDFAGGIININTKDFPEEFFATLSLGTSYNTLTNTNNFVENVKGKYDWIGIDDGTRTISSQMPDKSTYLNDSLTSKADRFNVSKSFNNNYYVKEKAKANFGRSFQFSTGGRTKLLSKNFASIVSVSHSSSEKFNLLERNDFDAERNRIFSYTDENYSYNALSGALANFSMELNSKNKLSFRNNMNVTGNNTTTIRSGVNNDLNTDVKGYAFNYSSKFLSNSQLAGEHKLDGRKLILDWNLAYNRMDRNEPDYRRLMYNRDKSEQDALFYAQVPYGSASKDGGRFYSNLFESSYSYAANLKVPFESIGIKDENASIKIGYIGQQRDRDFAGRVLGYIVNSPSKFNFNLLAKDVNSIFADENMGNNGFRISDITNNSDKYVASSSLNAGYAMVDYKIKSLRISTGLRLEDFSQKLNSFQTDGKTPVNVENKNADLLPSINLTYSLTEKTNLRFAASKTLTRPEFREIATFSFYDFTSGVLVIGNPGLKRGTINNYDLRFETYPGIGQIFSISAFYKDFSNPIEQVIALGSGAGSRTRTFRNVERAYNQGLELEFRKNLSFISEKAKNFTLFMNTSFIKSAIDLKSVANSSANSRPLQGQSPYVFNTGINFASVQTGWNSTLLFNQIGRRIVEVGDKDYGDIYEKERGILDFQIAKTIKKHFELKLNISDILHQDLVFYQDENKSNKFEKGRDNLIQKQNFGRTYSFSVTYKF